MSTQTRADASRNRAALIEAATRAFAASEEEPSMRAIARETGVGIGTLYRHFPTRESLVEAVYHDQLVRLVTGVEELLQTFPPAEAMRQWMDRFAIWVATKRGMAETLRTMITSGEIPHAESRVALLGAIRTILDAGSAAGDLRADTSPEDVAASLVGVFMVAGAPNQREQAARLLDLLMDGLRPRG